MTKVSGESYESFVAQASENPIGLQVKIADVEDNLDESRLPVITINDRRRLEKYRRALAYLRGEEAALTRAPMLRDMTPTTTIEQLERAVPTGTILATDFYVDGIETGKELSWGYAVGRVENIDHHAPTPRMARPVSSAHLALDRVRQIGPSRPDETVVINHADCDSVLAAAILLGLVEPSDRLARAAEAADHTGAEDEIADALQALDPCRDFARSLHTLRRILYGAGVGAELSADLKAWKNKRAQANESAPSFRRVGRVAWAELDGQVDGAFFPTLLPDAEIIVVGCKPPRPDRWFIKVRLGLAAKAGSSLQNLGITTMDPAYGGRWNAGSNKRGGGSAIGPEAYAEHIAVQIIGDGRWASSVSK